MSQGQFLKVFLVNRRKTRLFTSLHMSLVQSKSIAAIDYPKTRLINICVFTLQQVLLFTRMTHFRRFFPSSPAAHTSTSGEGTTLTGDRGRGRCCHTYNPTFEASWSSNVAVDNRGSLSMKFQEQLDQQRHPCTLESLQY